MIGIVSPEIYGLACNNSLLSDPSVESFPPLFWFSFSTSPSLTTCLCDSQVFPKHPHMTQNVRRPQSWPRTTHPKKQSEPWRHINSRAAILCWDGMSHARFSWLSVFSAGSAGFIIYITQKCWIINKNRKIEQQHACFYISGLKVYFILVFWWKREPWRK